MVWYHSLHKPTRLSDVQQLHVTRVHYMYSGSVPSHRKLLNDSAAKPWVERGAVEPHDVSNIPARVREEFISREVILPPQGVEVHVDRMG
jgi:hypothetical protein